MQTVMMKHHHIGVISRHIADDMSERETIERLPELRNGLAGAAGDIFLVNLLKELEYSRVAPHQRLQHIRLPLIRQLNVVERLPVHIDPHFSRNVNLL